MKRGAVHSGLVAHANAPGVLMHEKTAAKLKFTRGDFICIASDAHDTVIVRQLKALQKPKAVLANYAYLDCESLGLLQVGLDEPLEVWLAEFPMDCP